MSFILLFVESSCYPVFRLTCEVISSIYLLFIRVPYVLFICFLFIWWCVNDVIHKGIVVGEFKKWVEIISLFLGLPESLYERITIRHSDSKTLSPIQNSSEYCRKTRKILWERTLQTRLASVDDIFFIPMEPGWYTPISRYNRSGVFNVDRVESLTWTLTPSAKPIKVGVFWGVPLFISKFWIQVLTR